jgi:hypothetical protein
VTVGVVRGVLCYAMTDQRCLEQLVEKIAQAVGTERQSVRIYEPLLQATFTRSHEAGWLTS